MTKRLMSTVGAALALLLGAGAAQAATYTVTTLADDGSVGSLRWAITQANNTPLVPDTINFSVSGTIELGSTLPTITDELTIDGAGRSVTISGNNSVRVISNASVLTLNALTIANGACNVPSCTQGAGVSSFGALVVSNSTFSGNSAAGAAAGGGIYGAGRTIIRNSTFSGNTAAGTGGGAVVMVSASASLTITNSTFFGNSAESGGAVWVVDGPATLTHNTFFGNTTSGAGAGGAFRLQSNARISLANNIFASSGAGLNCTNFGGSVTDQGGNLSDDASCGFTAPSVNDTNPQLEGLQDNGGPTLTMAPQMGSPAIGQGVNQLAIDAGLTTDQRGLPRIAPVGGTVDRGAVEVAGLYAFTGFFAPVDNGMVNLLKAGSAVPVKFSLNGYQGLAIFAPGSPASQAVSCAMLNLSSTAPVEETVTAGGSGLQYDTTSGQYTYVWKTQKEWKGSCRKLILNFNDGSTQEALFKFN